MAYFKQYLHQIVLIRSHFVPPGGFEMCLGSDIHTVAKIEFWLNFWYICWLGNKSYSSFPKNLETSHRIRKCEVKYSAFMTHGWMKSIYETLTTWVPARLVCSSPNSYNLYIYIGISQSCVRIRSELSKLQILFRDQYHETYCQISLVSHVVFALPRPIMSWLTRCEVISGLSMAHRFTYRW